MSQVLLNSEDTASHDTYAPAHHQNFEVLLGLLGPPQTHVF